MGPLLRLVMFLLRRLMRAPGGLRGAARQVARGGPRPVPPPPLGAGRRGRPMRADRDRDDPPGPWGSASDGRPEGR
jgi:hypothetical protein